MYTFLHVHTYTTAIWKAVIQDRHHIHLNATKWLTLTEVRVTLSYVWLIPIHLDAFSLHILIHSHNAHVHQIHLNVTKWLTLTEVHVTISYVWLIPIHLDVFKLLIFIYSHVYICAQTIHRFERH